MINLIKNDLRNEEGFTLIELLVVIVIIGVLAAIALPIFLNQQKAALDASVKSDIRNAALSLQTYYTKYKTFPFSNPDLTKIDLKIGDKEAYTKVNNFLLCLNVGGPDKGNYGIFAQSVSGNVYSYTSIEGKLKERDDIVWPRGFAVTCTLAGMDSTTNNSSSGFWGYTNNHWLEWAN